MQLPLLLLFALFVAPSLPLSLTTPQSLSSLTSLLSGSDIRGEFGTTLTCENSSRIGKIFGRFVCECTDDAIPRVLIGRDPRVHGSDLTSAFSRGVISAGCVVEVRAGGAKDGGLEQSDGSILSTTILMTVCWSLRSSPRSSLRSSPRSSLRSSPRSSLLARRSVG